MIADKPSGTSDLITARKRQAAARGVSLVKAGATVGLGSGSTAEIAVELLGERVREGLRIRGVPTSARTERFARGAGISIVTLNDVDAIDITLDGADEIDLSTFFIIKGRGGALLREKLVATASQREVILVDESKVVGALGAGAPVPVEVVLFGWRRTVAALERLGARVTPRSTGDGLLVTDGGNAILDCAFGPILDAPRLAGDIKSIPGVVEHGLFIGLAHLAIVAGPGGVVTHSRPSGHGQ